jgi:hypothetical protein
MSCGLGTWQENGLNFPIAGYLAGCLLRGNLSLMRGSPRPIGLFVGWIATGMANHEL